jgi:hypothetical protein
MELLCDDRAVALDPARCGPDWHSLAHVLSPC